MFNDRFSRTRDTFGPRTIVAFAGLALLMGLTVACSDDDDDPTPTAKQSTSSATAAASVSATTGSTTTASATAAPSATATRAARTTGIAAVDTTIAALTSGDAAKIKPLLKYLPLKCTNAVGLGGPPKCPAGVAEGTVLNVFGVGSGEGSYIQAGTDAETMLLGQLGAAGRVIYAVYKPTPTTARPNETPPPTYVVITQSSTGTAPIRFSLDADGKIIYVTLISAPTAAEIMSRDNPVQVLVPPL